MNNQTPLFILGCPRSGTTLLASLLEFTDYGKPFETHFVTKYYKKLREYGDLSNKGNFTRLINDIASERYIKQWKVNINAAEIYLELEDYSFRTIVNHLCMIKNRNTKHTSWGDKTPHYTLDIEIIHSLFPDSKYIFIVRDGRDVALSLLEKSWGPNNIMSCAELWKKYHVPNQLLDSLREKKQLFSLRYEDLLSNPDAVIPELYKFLAADYNKVNERGLTARIKKNNCNKWQQKLTKKQISIFEKTASNTLKKFRYSYTYKESPLNFYTKWTFSIHETLMKMYSLFKLNLVDGIKIRFFGKEPFSE